MTISDDGNPKFDWPLAHGAEELLRGLMDGFLGRNGFARRLAERMREETGTDFYEWVDHLTVDPALLENLTGVGLREETIEAPPGTRVLHHPKAMMPRVLVQPGGSQRGIPLIVAIRVESLADFEEAHRISAGINGPIGAGLRKAMIAPEVSGGLEGVERLGYRGFVQKEVPSGFAERVKNVRELWGKRSRSFPDDASGVRHAFLLQEKAIEMVGTDVACDLFFAEERAFWGQRNSAARVQKRRQDRLGLGWANHDHHTYRCSRALFADVVEFFGRFGFRKRERYYAGAEAGWGAQIMEQPVTGIVVFADVDLMPQEIEVDFSTRRLPEAGKLGTVGLWCALHGDSFLQAGMHHLEARFDFPRLRDQLATEGIGSMKPFSDFPFLKQAFTEGERWKVSQERLAKLLARGLITAEQAESFARDGAIGSHLENLQRRGGFKGFNQKSVSAIIAATDPRNVREVSNA